MGLAARERRSAPTYLYTYALPTTYYLVGGTYIEAGARVAEGPRSEVSNGAVR